MFNAAQDSKGGVGYGGEGTGAQIRRELAGGREAGEKNSDPFFRQKNTCPSQLGQQPLSQHLALFVLDCCKA